MNPNVYPGSDPNRKWIRIVLIVLLFVALLGSSTVAYFFFFHDTGGQGNNGTGGQGNSGTITTSTETHSPGTSGKCTNDSPYGFTTIHADAQLVAYYKQLNVCWVRYQYHWNQIEKSPGTYNWSQVDTAIAAMNAAGIHVDFAIQKVPDFHMTQSCLGVPFLAGPDDMKQFASLIATRYDGKHGHGQIDAFEIGNEEYDNFYIKGNRLSLSCRDASYYGPVLKAGYQAIKAVNPHALVGMFGMWYRNDAHIRDYMTYLYTNGYGAYMDYMNFHYYSEGDPTAASITGPSFDDWWKMMHDIASQHGFPNKPIWVTEIGWPTTGKPGDTGFVSPTTQANYLRLVMTDAAQSGIIKKVFWFTINYGKQSDNIYPQGGPPLPAFQMYHDIVQQKPQWN